MSTVRRILELDAETDRRIDALAAEKGVDAASVVAEAVEFLDTFIDIDEPPLEEDLARLRAYEATGEAVPHDAVLEWVRSWGTPNELPPPVARKVR